VQEACRIYCVQSIPKRDKGRTLGQEHQKTIEAFEQVGIALWFQELQSKI